MGQPMGEHSTQLLQGDVVQTPLVLLRVLGLEGREVAIVTLLILSWTQLAGEGGTGRQCSIAGRQSKIKQELWGQDTAGFGRG